MALGMRTLNMCAVTRAKYCILGYNNKLRVTCRYYNIHTRVD